MNKKLLLIGLCILFLIINIIFAIEITSFTNDLSKDNMTFDGAGNFTYFMDIPMYISIGNMSLILTGFSGYNYVYDEHNDSGAEAATGCTVNMTNTTDGNWSTYTTVNPNCNYYFDYNKTDPLATEDSIIQTKGGATPSINNTIGSDCFDQYSNVIKYKVVVDASTMRIQCDRGSWYTIISYSGSYYNRLYETATWWYTNNDTSFPSNISITSAGIILYNNITEVNRTNSPQNVKINITPLNSTVNSCDCSNCSKPNDYTCRVPFSFKSDTAGILQYSDISLNYTFGIDNCSTYTSKAINFIFKDEENNSNIPADYEATFNFEYAGYSDTYSVSDSDEYNFSICLSSPMIEYTGNYSIYYSDTNYPQRRYYDNSAVYDNITQTINLYLLDVDEGIYVRFRVTDQYGTPLNNVEIDMQKDGVTVEQETTDSSGLATFWVNPDVDYSFSFVKSGYTTVTYSLRPTTSEIYHITMNEEIEAIPYSYSTGITYNFLPSNINLNNQTDYDFIFNMTSTYWDITYCILTLKNTTTTLTSSTTSYDSDSCEISINYNTGSQTTIISEAMYELNNSVNITVSQQYTVIYTYEGDFSLKNFVDDLKAFSQAGFNDFTRMVIALIVIVSILIYVASKLTINDPMPMLLLAIVLVWFLSYVGFLTLNYEPIPTEWLKQYILAILVTLGGGAFLIAEQTR